MTGDAPAVTTLKLENHHRTLEVQELPLERDTALWIQVSSEHMLFHHGIHLNRDEVKRLAHTLNKWLCDPCQFCQNIYDDSDPSVGLEGYGCSYYDGPVEDDEWEPGCGRPCPGFSPTLVSDDLEHQLC